MATETQSEKNTKKDITNKDGEVTKLIEWATQDVENVDDLIALFGSQGVAYSTGGEITGDYQVITGNEKQLFAERVVGKRLFVVKWEFYPGQRKDTEFVAMHMLIDGIGKFIVNDGAKSGMYGQLSKITSQRISQGVSDSHAKTGLLVERGIRKNDPFQYDTRSGKALKKDGTDKDSENFVPEEFRATSHPTWSFVF